LVSLEKRLNRYLETRDRLLTDVKGLSAAVRDASPGPNRWAVCQVLDHLVVSERQIAKIRRSLGAAD
jgi:uncharacterized damage-inducible protein DinB